MKKLFFTLAVAAPAFFTSCVVDDDTPFDLTLRATSVTDAPADVVKVRAVNVYNDVVVGSGSFTANGFAMDIRATPSSDALSSMELLKDMFKDPLPGDIEISDTDAQYFMISFRGYNISNKHIGRFEAETTTGSISYWYVDRNVTVKGSFTDYFRSVYDLTFEKGWNRIIYTFSDDDNSFTITLTSPVPCGTEIEWSFVPASEPGNPI